MEVVPTGSAESSDYGPVSAQVTFGPGAELTSIEIQIIDDQFVESTEFFKLGLSSSDPAVVLVRPDRTKVIIRDNDGE